MQNKQLKENSVLEEVYFSTKLSAVRTLFVMCDSQEEQLSFLAMARTLWSIEMFQHGTFGNLATKELC